MTEEEWLASDDLYFLMRPIWESKIGSERCLRFYTLACCLRCSEWFPNPHYKTALTEMERFADRLVKDAALFEFRLDGPTQRELREEAEANPTLPNLKAAAYEAAMAVGEAISPNVPHHAYPFRVDQVVLRVASATAYAAPLHGNSTAEENWKAVYDQTFRSLSRLTREIFGNPFRPVTFDPVWRTMDVRLLANGIYEEKAFDRMPILADALQDAGCDSAELLNHLRDPHATHVRGCWALDLVLEKK